MIIYTYIVITVAILAQAPNGPNGIECGGLAPPLCSGVGGFSCPLSGRRQYIAHRCRILRRAARHNMGDAGYREPVGGGNVRITVAFTTNRRKQQVMAFAIILEMCGPQLTVQIFKVDKDACLPEYERMYERPVFDWHLVKCGASPRLSWDIPELAALSVSNALINVVAHKRALVNAFDEE